MEDTFIENEILDSLKEHLEEGSTKEELMKELNINELTLFGYIKKLKDSGLNISTVTKKGEQQYFINNAPDYSKDYSININENINDHTKFAVISDLRFGSKNEQIEILNEMYKKFAEDGVKYVFIAGNLLEGRYNPNDEKIYGKSLISNTAEGQANHLIEYFPKCDSIKTMFITGAQDHTWSKELNVGSYIESKRPDLVFLGPSSCDINFNNVKIKLENIKKTGESYTVSYTPQKYSRSMPDYETYDAILLGGTLSAQDFPQIKDTRILTIPSVVSRTLKMKSRKQSNTIGAYVFDLTYDKKGSMKRLVPELMPYYKPAESNYMSVSPITITKEDDKVNVVSSPNVDFLGTYGKLYSALKKEETFTSLSNRLGLNATELMGLIDILNENGLNVTINQEGNDFIVRKEIVKSKAREIKLPKEELHKKSFGVVSDTHYGSIYSQPSFVNTFAYEAYNRGITDMFHVGDISDGDYHTIRPNYVNEVFLYGATAHVDYVAETLPKYKGMNWYGVCGSHDQSHSFNYGPFDFGKELAARRKDFTYLGQDIGEFYYDNCKIELFHPGGGSTRILSTKVQNGIDGLPKEKMPALQLRGHYHKVYYMLYRGVHTLLCPCNVDQSSFMMKNEIPNMMGDYFVTIWYDDEGKIEYIETEPMIFTEQDVRDHDYENPKKYLKNKITTKK